MLDNKIRPGRNDATRSDAFAKHSFPPDGLVAQSRIAYESTPLLTAQIRSGVFVIAGAGGNLTAIAGSQGGTMVDTGYGPALRRLKTLSPACSGECLNGLSIRTGISIIPMATPPLPRPVRRSSPMPMAVRACR